MPSSIPENGNTLDVVVVGNNRIGKVQASNRAVLMRAPGCRTLICGARPIRTTGGGGTASERPVAGAESLRPTGEIIGHTLTPLRALRWVKLLVQTHSALQSSQTSSQGSADHRACLADRNVPRLRPGNSC